jgi:hypothetical protein
MLNKLICKIFFHKLEVVREFTPMIRQVRCTRCYRVYGMNDEIQAFLEWDRDLDLIHRFVFPDKYYFNK